METLGMPTPRLAIAGLVGVFVGAQLPDIDSRSSKIGRCTKPLSNFISHFGHRGFTHSLFGLTLVFIIVDMCLKPIMPMYVLTDYTWQQLLNWLIIGYCLHIFEDAGSKAGVIWFFPMGDYRRWYPRRKYRYKHGKRKRNPPIYIRTRIHTRWRYKTGGRGELYIRYMAIILLAVEIYFLII